MHTLKKMQLIVSIYQQLAAYPDAENIIAKKDPTMLFMGLLWGKQNYQLLRAFWPLKTALFYYGDLIIEKVISTVGLSEFKQHYNQEKSKHTFYLFSQAHIEQAQCVQTLEFLQQGYEDCEKQVLKSYKKQADKIMAQWINATNLAIDSVFIQKQWEEALHNKKVATLQEIVQKEETAKNILVVNALYEAATLLENQLPFSGSEYKMIRASSHWFTLIDDYLDVIEDDINGEPNYILAYLHENKEYKQWSQNDHEVQQCPLTFAIWQEHITQARVLFKRDFIVFPNLFIQLFEWRARKKLLSPF